MWYHSLPQGGVVSAKDHPNNAPGVPMVFPPMAHRLQVKYVNPVVKKVARRAARRMGVFVAETA